MKQAAIGFFIGVNLVMWVTYARAQGAESGANDVNRAEARQRFDSAQQAFERGDYASALTEWERVYELLDGDPRREYVVFNIARANEELGRTQAAADGFERYLANTPPDAPNRSDAQRHLQELRLRLDLQERDHGAGEASSGPPGAFALSPAGIAIAAVGLASIVAGAVIGGVALSQDGSGRAECDSSSCTQAGYDTLVGAHTLANVSDGLLWGGIGVAAVGAILAIALGGNGDTSATAACNGTGCRAVVQGRF